MSRIVVDLPEPFGPRKPVTTPGWTVNVRAVDGAFVPVVLRQPLRLDQARQRSSGYMNFL